MSKLGIVKSYYKFKLDNLFGVIGCDKSNICFLPNKNGTVGTLCVIGFAEDVLIWDVKGNKILKTIPGELGDKVTYLAYFQSNINQLRIAIGYESGYVSIYSLWDFERLMHAKCHTSAICFIINCNTNDDRIICGSKDTTISVIDTFQQRGFSLKGHTAPITCLQYLPSKDILISSCQTGLIKFWNLSSQRSFKSFPISKEVWGFHLNESAGLLITGGSESHLELWNVGFATGTESFEDLNTPLSKIYDDSIRITPVGRVERENPKRIIEMKIDQNDEYLICNSGTKRLQLYKILNDIEYKKRLKKKMKKAISKNNESTNDEALTEPSRLKHVRDIEIPSGCKSVSVRTKSKPHETVELLCSMKNNTVAIFSLDLPSCKEMTTKEHIADLGHRTAIIYCQFTSDRNGLFTVSLSEAKLWIKSAFKPFSTIEWCSENKNKKANRVDEKQKLMASCGLLLPGDRFAVIGFKNGWMYVYSLKEGTLIQSIKHHQDSITSLVLSPDKMSMISASTDKSVNIWSMKYASNNASKDQMELSCSTLNNSSIPHFNHGISCLSITSDNRLWVIGFLDNKVRTYLPTDLTQRVLDLHGHTEPVTAISIRYDNEQIITGSGDKSVRTWNLPFGDSKIFRGHNHPVTDVKYIPGRYQAFSSDKSGLIIHIDLVNMTEIYRLLGHSTTVCRLAIVADGIDKDEGFEENGELLSVGTDSSVRLWYEAGGEIVSREAEEEARIDRQYEQEELANHELFIVGDPQGDENGFLIKKTLRTENDTDSLIESIEYYVQWKLIPDLPPNQTMASMKITRPLEYFGETLAKIPRSDVEMVLGQLPMNLVPPALELLNRLYRGFIDPYLTGMCIGFLVELHMCFLMSDTSLKPLIKSLAVPVHGKYSVSDILQSQLGLVKEALEYHFPSIPEEPIFVSGKRPKKLKKRKM